MQQRLVTVVLGVLLGMPYSAPAQHSSGLESLANRVKPGATLSVATTDGEELRAHFDRATASELTVSVRDKTVVLAANKVARVEQHDSSWNGAAIGGAVGGAVG